MKKPPCGGFSVLGDFELERGQTLLEVGHALLQPGVLAAHVGGFDAERLFVPERVAVSGRGVRHENLALRTANFLRLLPLVVAEEAVPRRVYSGFGKRLKNTLGYSADMYAGIRSSLLLNRIKHLKLLPLNRIPNIKKRIRNIINIML